MGKMKKPTSPIPGSEKWFHCGHGNMQACDAKCCCHARFQYDGSKGICRETTARVDTVKSKGVLAVFICGTLERLLLHSKVEQVVQPVVQDGYQVEVYLSATSAHGSEYMKVGHRATSPEEANTSENNCWEDGHLCKVFEEAV